MESLPASVALVARALCLTFGKVNYRYTFPQCFVPYLPCYLAEGPAVHHPSELPTIPISLTIAKSDPSNIFEDDGLSILEGSLYDILRGAVQDIIHAVSSSKTIFRGDLLPYPLIISLEGGYNFFRIFDDLHALGEAVIDDMFLVPICHISQVSIDASILDAFHHTHFFGDTDAHCGGCGCEGTYSQILL